MADTISSGLDIIWWRFLFSTVIRLLARSMDWHGVLVGCFNDYPGTLGVWI
jgi:hypothetical protein